MPQAENNLLPGATNDSWRTWLMTGARHDPVDRRRVRGSHQGLKRMLIEGMTNGEGRSRAWKDFSGAMIRHAVDEAMRTLPPQDKQAVKLAYFGGYSNRQIAQHIGLTEGSVQRRLRRALAAISDHIQHGGRLGRRALYAMAIWVTGRWVSDLAHHTVQAVTVAAATAIIVSHPVPVASPVQAPAQPVQASASAQVQTVVPPMPSPTSLAASVSAASVRPPAPPPVDQPVVKLPTVKLPPLPVPPVKVKSPTL